ncbi:MAG: response regulator [Anaerolineae bacterium]|nr:response regulator [Anaerolineae bacterium]
MNRSSRRILVVDDDLDTCALIVDALSDEGYVICACTGGEQALDVLGHESFDLVLTDIKMPSVTGVDLLQRIRETNRDTSVILMTAYASIDTAIQAVRHDAADYLIKPFATQDLRQRVRDALPEAVGVYHDHQYRDLRINLDARRVWAGEYELELTRQEFDVLALLLQRKGCTVTWQELLQQVWGYQDPQKEQAKIVRSCIRRLRKKLRDHARDPKYIYTRWGEGYRLGT